MKKRKLEGVSDLELVDAAWLAGRISLLGRAGFMNLKLYPNGVSWERSTPRAGPARQLPNSRFDCW
jgi:hypothetical protein